METKTTTRKEKLPRHTVGKFTIKCPKCQGNKRFTNLKENATYNSKCTRCGFKW